MFDFSFSPTLFPLPPTFGHFTLKKKVGFVQKYTVTWDFPFGS